MWPTVQPWRLCFCFVSTNFKPPICKHSFLSSSEPDGGEKADTCTSRASTHLLESSCNLNLSWSTAQQTPTPIEKSSIQTMRTTLDHHISRYNSIGVLDPTLQWRLGCLRSHCILKMSRCCAADCTLPATSANSRSWERTVPQSVGRTMRRKLGMLQSISSLRRTKLRWACSTSSRGVEASTNSVISCNSGQIWISEVDETWHKKQEPEGPCHKMASSAMIRHVNMRIGLPQHLRYRRVGTCQTRSNSSSLGSFPFDLQNWNWVFSSLFADLAMFRHQAGSFAEVWPLEQLSHSLLWGRPSGTFLLLEAPGPRIDTTNLHCNKCFNQKNLHDNKKHPLRSSAASSRGTDPRPHDGPHGS